MKVAELLDAAADVDDLLGTGSTFREAVAGVADLEAREERLERALTAALGRLVVVQSRVDVGVDCTAEIEAARAALTKPAT